MTSEQEQEQEQKNSRQISISISGNRKYRSSMIDLQEQKLLAAVSSQKSLLEQQRPAIERLIEKLPEPIDLPDLLNRGKWVLTNTNDSLKLESLKLKS